MIPSRSVAGKLARGLRGFASAKKAPGFYKPSTAASSDAAAAQNPAPKPGVGSSEGAATAKIVEGQAAGSAASAGDTAASNVANTAAIPSSSQSSASVAKAPTASTPSAASTSATAPASAAPKPAGQPATPPPPSPSTAAAAPPPTPAASQSAASAGQPAAKAPVALPAVKPAAPTPPAAKPAAPAPPAAKPAVPAASPATPRPPAAGTSGGGGAGGGTPGAGGATKNNWLLHPSLPVDVRLLAAGLAGAGALAYTMTGSSGGGGEDQAAEPPKEVVEADFTMRPEEEESAAAVPEEAPAQLAPAAEPADPKLRPIGAAAEVGVSPEAVTGVGAQPEGDAATAAAEDEPKAEEEVTYVDASQVLGVIEEVFSKDVQQQLRELEERAAAEASKAPPLRQQQDGSAAAAAAPAAAQDVPAPAASGAPQHAVEARQAGEETKQRPDGHARKRGGAGDDRQAADERAAAVHAAMADQAGEAVASDIVKRSHPGGPSLSSLLPARKQAAAPPAGQEQAAPPPPPAAELAPAELAEAVERARRLLGVEADISASGLIAESISHGMGPQGDWSDYAQRHRQAEADAAVLARLLGAAADAVERQLDAARRDAEAGRAEAAAARRQAAEQAERFRAVLKEALSRAEEQQRQLLRRQAEQLATAHAEMTVRERAERAARLDDVRRQLAALETAFQRRSNERRTSHAAHQLSVGATALRSALAAGEPLGAALPFLRSLSADDPVVAAALAGLPSEAAQAPVPTRPQLAARFEEVRRLSGALGMLPEGHGGLLSLAVAKLAASLKIAERASAAAALPGDSLEAQLAAAKQRVVDGDLLAAVSQLEQAMTGTAAAHVVADWARAVRTRVVAEQSAALLEAHAAAETASLA